MKIAVATGAGGDSVATGVGGDDVQIMLRERRGSEKFPNSCDNLGR